MLLTVLRIAYFVFRHWKKFSSSTTMIGHSIDALYSARLRRKLVDNLIVVVVIVIVCFAMECVIIFVIQSTVSRLLCWNGIIIV